MGRVCCLLQCLRLEFEAIRSQLLIRESPLSFENTVIQLLNEESPLEEQKGVGECFTFAIPDQKANRPTQDGQSSLVANEINKC